MPRLHSSLSERLLFTLERNSQVSKEGSCPSLKYTYCLVVGGKSRCNTAPWETEGAPSNHHSGVKETRTQYDTYSGTKPIPWLPPATTHNQSGAISIWHCAPRAGKFLWFHGHFWVLCPFPCTVKTPENYFWTLNTPLLPPANPGLATDKF